MSGNIQFQFYRLGLKGLGRHMPRRIQVAIRPFNIYQAFRREDTWKVAGFNKERDGRQRRFIL